jgi:hypothetical protein
MGGVVERSEKSVLAQGIVDFALHGAFPEGDVSSQIIQTAEIPAAIVTLKETQTKLEVCFNRACCTTCSLRILTVRKNVE